MKTLLAAALALLVAGTAPDLLSGQASLLPLLETSADSVAFEEGRIRPANVELAVSYRSGWTDDRDNGALWAGRGLSSRVSAGVSGRWGPLLLTVRPDAVWSQNQAFPVAARIGAGPVGSAAPWLAVDLPRIRAEGRYTELLPGTSGLVLRFPRVQLGASTAALVRGGERRYPLVLGNSAPGAPHVFAEGAVGGEAVGTWSMRLQWGLLRESPEFDVEETLDRALLTGLFVDWATPWNENLVFGASLLYRDPMEEFSPDLLFKAFTTSARQDAEEKREDALAAVHARWTSTPLTLWASLARGDYWDSAEDAVSDLAHSLIYAVGLEHRWGDGPGTDPDPLWMLHVETARTGRSPFRGNTVYRHGDAGHTHRGQMLGASIGPGSAGTFASLTRSLGTGRIGGELERVVHDEILYAARFSRQDGPGGQDREWRAAAIYRGSRDGLRERGLSVFLRLGAATRWNRDYLQYAEPEERSPGFRETNVLLDLAVSWTPAGGSP